MCVCTVRTLASFVLENAPNHFCTTTFASFAPFPFIICHISFIFSFISMHFTMCLVKRLHRVLHETLLLPVTILSRGWLEQGTGFSGFHTLDVHFFFLILFCCCCLYLSCCLGGNLKANTHHLLLLFLS